MPKKGHVIKGSDVTNHFEDFTSHIDYAAASGSANTYTATLSPAPTVYVEGMACAIKINVDNTASSTINLNGLGAKTIKKANGGTVSAGNLKAGSIYTLRYNGTDFILQGEGGSGNAQPSEVLSGKTFTNDAGDQTGTMANFSGSVVTDGASTVISGNALRIIPTASGYYATNSQIGTTDNDWIEANIKVGVNIFGKLGTFTSDATATAAQIRSGQTAYVNGSKLTGTLTVQATGTQTVTPTTTNIVKAAGIYDGAITIEGDAGLVSTNIKSGVSIFGVAGNSNVVDTSPGTAVAADILATKIAFVDGAQITGTMVNNGAGGTVTPGTTNQTKAAGYYSSSITISGDADLVSGNIKSGANIFGVAGSANVVDTSPGTAVAGDILSGKIAFVDGAQVTGTMTNNGYLSHTPTTYAYNLMAGYYSGGNIPGDPDLVSSNIRTGKDIFGVAGSLNPYTEPRLVKSNFVITGFRNAERYFIDPHTDDVYYVYTSESDGGVGVKHYRAMDGLYIPDLPGFTGYDQDTEVIHIAFRPDFIYIFYTDYITVGDLRLSVKKLDRSTSSIVATYTHIITGRTTIKIFEPKYSRYYPSNIYILCDNNTTEHCYNYTLTTNNLNMLRSTTITNQERTSGMGANDTHYYDYRVNGSDLEMTAPELGIGYLRKMNPFSNSQVLSVDINADTVRPYSGMSTNKVTGVHVNLINTHVLVQSYDTLHCYRASNLTKRWSVPLDRLYKLYVTDTTVVAINSDVKILDLETGSTIHTRPISVNGVAWTYYDEWHAVNQIGNTMYFFNNPDKSIYKMNF